MKANEAQEKYIPKSALVAEIKRRIKEIDEIGTYLSPKGVLINLLCHLNTLEGKEVDLELITGWFDHIAQIADDRKTLNGVIMEDWAALDEIKCLAKNSSEFIQKHYKAQKGEYIHKTIYI